MKVCALEGCDQEFTPKTHNQKYHSDECCRVATNKQIMARYYKNKERRAGALRYCEKKCGTLLSRYNATEICQSCAVKESQRGKADILRALGFVNY